MQLERNAIESEMSSSGELSWLCRLIDQSLRSYTELEGVVLICEEKEKEVLIALCQVLRKIELRIRGSNSNEEETVAKTAPNGECLCGLDPHSSARHCLSKIVGDMMILLTIKSQFVQHLAVKVLVLTSKFVSTTGNNWNEFVQLLCCLLEVEIARCGAETSNSDLSDIKFLKQYGLKKCDWSIVSGINQVLRAVFKYLKEDCDDQLVKVYYDSVNSSLSKVPWHLLDQHQLCFIDKSKKSSSTDPRLSNFNAMEPGIKFLGTFLQLLCSLVDPNDSVETGGDSAKEHSLLVTVVNLVPRLIKWCLNKQGDRLDMRTIQYFRHKLLILMIRLCSYKSLDCFILLSWLKLLHNYFQELLWQPLTQFQSDQGECLEGSPFLLSLSDEVSGMHSSHLQRQTIFLFLDCSSSLISKKEDPADHCICSTLNSCLTNNSDSESDYCCRRKGLLELYKWLQRHLPTEISINHEKYSDICVNFMSSFLQLYLGEDDLLFEVLLQLLGITSSLQQQFDKEEAALQDIKKDFPFCLLDVFNPVQLFHLFLSEIHYDHQILLDFLISKDVGISCAKYLLRCLSLVCNSWKSFVEFPLFGESLKQSSSKKRKVRWDDPELLADVTPFIMDNKGIITSPVKNYEEDGEYGFKPFYTQGFKEAKDCLLSLKDSVENLHQKNLFPYNPEVLLKRLKKFEDLSCEGKGFHVDKTD